jgi:aryl-alcohol dehydrogenase-like predicted oxidoreductase
MQNHYSLLYREEEREMFPTLKVGFPLRCMDLCTNFVPQYFGVGSIPWSPLARGALSRPLSQQSNRAETELCGLNSASKHSPLISSV